MSTRVPKAEFDGPVEEMIERFGAVPEPIEVMWHQPAAASALAELGAKTGEWKAADESLKSFAHMAVAARVGCSWCLDIGYFAAANANLDLEKASQVPRWREASYVFTPLERDVMAYAEAMTNTPPTVTDDMAEGLLEELGLAAMVELTAFIGFANLSTRSNVALGIESQGFSADCEIPLAIG
jgi:alkylhydroperoxidase family enzyme